MATAFTGTSRIPRGSEWTSDAGEQCKAPGSSSSRGPHVKSEAEEFVCPVQQAGLSGHLHTKSPEPTESVCRKWKSVCVSTRCVGKTNCGSIFQSSHVIPSLTAGRVVLTRSQWLENMADPADFHHDAHCAVYYSETSTWQYQFGQKILFNCPFFWVHSKWPGVVKIL